MNIWTETLQGLAVNSSQGAESETDISEVIGYWRDIEILTQPECRVLGEYPRHSHEGLEGYAFGVRKIP